VVSEVADRLAVMYAGRVVEAGDADTVLTRPSHPYTEALLRSVPRLEHHGADLFTIPGSPPNPARVPSGCPFHPRCHRVVDACATVRPELVPLAGRSVACHQSEVVLDVR
jgi:oligopeptide transport system ATP-binding protein